MLVLQVIN